ncbi:hypothetical protein GCM10012275_13380 [Longimycelium tulufanense]|uniref:Uncharacterized protein n=1 Tax=Longimycelium tulufanense TaxID=907463 RepID=A0A8J3CBY0_9PSEU|nr:hypothetical protein [Longimycelium tulufanense]GGM43714.1 hypothetical protein GCM10012275_13380 [Longimycelium tulufanense]
MADTSIRLPAEVRDRIARLADEHGTTLGEMVRQLAESMPTNDERERILQHNLRYIRDVLGIDTESQEWKEAVAHTDAQLAELKAELARRREATA